MIVIKGAVIEVLEIENEESSVVFKDCEIKEVKVTGGYVAMAGNGDGNEKPPKP